MALIFEPSSSTPTASCITESSNASISPNSYTTMACQCLIVSYPTTEVGGLCLASTAIQHPKDAALASMTGTSGESEDSTGPYDKWPVLVQHAGPGTLVGRERVTRWRTPPAERRVRSDGNVRMGELSLCRERECLSPPVQHKREGGADHSPEGRGLRAAKGESPTGRQTPGLGTMDPTAP